MLVTSIFSFSQNAFYPFQGTFKILGCIYCIVLSASDLDWSKILFTKDFTKQQNLRLVQIESSIFSFSQNAFYPFQGTFKILGCIYCIVLSASDLDLSKILFTKDFTKQQNLRLVQIESICRRQNKCEKNLEICFGKGRNIVGKEENDGYQHFLLFPQCFEKASFSGLLKVGIVW